MFDLAQHGSPLEVTPQQSEGGQELQGKQSGSLVGVRRGNDPEHGLSQGLAFAHQMPQHRESFFQGGLAPDLFKDINPWK